jgi:hypothetical protein
VAISNCFGLELFVSIENCLMHHRVIFGAFIELNFVVHIYMSVHT